MKFAYTLVSLLSLFILNSCNSGPTENSALNMKTSESDSVYNLCYSSLVKKDTVLLNALMFGDSIKGSLGYKLYEKEQKNGLILGKMYGDTLRALYTFMAGDSQFINEISFLRDDTLLTEGLGDRVLKGGKFVFTDNKKVQFKGLELVKSKCK